MSYYLSGNQKAPIEVLKRATYLIFSNLRLLLLIAVLCALQWGFELHKGYLNPKNVYFLSETHASVKWLYDAFIESYNPWQFLYLLFMGYVIFFIALNGFHIQIKEYHFSPYRAVKKTICRLVPYVLAMTIVYLMVIFGFVMLIVPGILAIIYFFSVPGVIVAENQGVSNSISRSIEITRNHKMLSFQTWLCMIGGLVIIVFVGLVLLALVGAFVPNMPDMILMVLYFGILIMIDAFIFAFISAMCIVHYENLKLNE